MLFGMVRARGDGGVRRAVRRHDVAARDIRELRSNKYDKSVRTATTCGPALRAKTGPSVAGQNRISLLVSDAVTIRYGR